MSTLYADPKSVGPTSEECWALLERVCASRQLKRSARLRDFLSFVGSQSIKHGLDGINEHEIGVMVFDRQADYDTSLDNIVRVNATELRKRLELYFADEGLGEEWILEIPRGGYTPIFHARPTVPQDTTLEAQVPDVEMLEAMAKLSSGEEGRPTSAIATRSKRNRTVDVILVALFTLLIGSCAYLVHQNSDLRGRLQPWKSEDGLKSFWSGFLGSGTEIDLVLADTSLALAKDIAGKPISLKDYVDYKYKIAPEWDNLSPERKADLTQVLDRDDGSLGDFRVARRIIALDPQSKSIKLRSAREYTPEAIRQNSVILIGSSESNPWVDLYKDQLNFSVEYNPVTHHSFVIDRAPVAPEKSVYEFPPDLSKTAGYSVIAFVPDLSGNGNALILGGTDSQATRAAGEFITNNDSMAKFRQNLPGGQFAHFEILLESSQLVGTPMKSKVVAFRVHAK
jgi:hypothetical protein